MDGFQKTLILVMGALAIAAVLVLVLFAPLVWLILSFIGWALGI